jgi:hypothetical protein
MTTGKRIIIGLALDRNFNKDVFYSIKRIISLLSCIFNFDVIFLVPSKLINLPTGNFKNFIYSDDSSLFDFSRYSRMLSVDHLRDDDIFFAFNDTLGSGRKFNTGLRLYLFIVFFILLNDKYQKYRFFAPVDKDNCDSWICPYFFIGKVNYLKTLNFCNWRYACIKTSKLTRLNLIVWLNLGWRRASSSSLEQKKIKYKTLLLERRLIEPNDISCLNFMFSRSNPFRIINSIPL